MLLTAKQRIAWRLCRKEGRPQTEVAQTLNVARESVNRLVRRADKRIQEFIARCPGGADCGLLEAILN